MATPASFTAHASNRNNTDEIIASQLSSNIDLLLGSGYDKYINYREKFEEKGYDLNIIDLDYDLDNDEVKKYNVGNILPVVIFLDKTADKTDRSRIESAIRATNNVENSVEN